MFKRFDFSNKVFVAILGKKIYLGIMTGAQKEKNVFGENKNWLPVIIFLKKKFPSENESCPV